MEMITPYDELLVGLEARGRLRQLAPAAGHDFTSNDYLGLAESAELKAAVQEALDRGVPAGRAVRGCFAAIIPSMPRWRRKRPSSSGPNQRFTSAAGLQRTTRCSLRCRSMAISWFTTRSSMPAPMTACVLAGRRLPRRRITMRRRSRTNPRLAGGGRQGPALDRG